MCMLPGPHVGVPHTGQGVVSVVLCVPIMVKLGSEIIDLQGATDINIFHATLPIDGTLDS